MNSALRLTPFTKAELAAVAQIEAEAAFMPWPSDLLAQCIRDDYRNQLMWLDDELLGYSICSTGADEAHLQNIVVKPSYQGGGYGYWLLTQTVQILQAQALQRLFLEVRASNHAAIHLYQRYGFEHIGLRRDYYEAPVGREDAHVYVLEL